MLHTATLFEPSGSASRPRSRKENDSGWRAYVQALEAASRSTAITGAFAALSASPFDLQKKVLTPEAAQSLVVAMSDSELDSLLDLLRKSVGFERPSNKEAPFTSLRYRQRKAMEAFALITAERMRRRIIPCDATPVAQSLPPTPVRRRSTRAGL